MPTLKASDEVYNASILPGTGGEIRQGTGGYSYSIRNSTALGNPPTWTVVGTFTVNKGYYFATGFCHGYPSSPSQARVAIRIKVGGVDVTGSAPAYSNTAIDASAWIMSPIFITADNTDITFEGTMFDGGAWNGGDNQMWVIKLGN